MRFPIFGLLNMAVFDKETAGADGIVDKWVFTLGRRMVVFEPPKRLTGWMSKVASFMVVVLKDRNHQLEIPGAMAMALAFGMRLERRLTSCGQRA